MSKDRPRKEKCCNLYEKVIVNTEVEFKGLGREMLEAIKTEAKIEVLEEVLEDLDNKFKQLAEMGSKPSKEKPRDITGDLFAKFFIAEKLDKLKKKKK